MLLACVEASVGNHGIRSATGMPIAMPTAPMIAICRNGRLRNVWTFALEHRHPGILWV